MTDLTSETLLCLDFEASSLRVGSYPIEVAIADVVSGVTHAWLIRPTAQWLAEGVWDAKSAAIHNIPLEQLLQEGLPVAQVAAELAAQCTGAQVLVDAPSYDGAWLTTLYLGAGFTAPPFQLSDFHTFATKLVAASEDDFAITLVDAAFEAQLRFPHTHRAAADARGNAEILRLLAGYP